MSATKIEWVQDADGMRGETWNPVVGCSKISPGCKHCYAINHVHRMAGNPNPKIRAANEGLTVLNGHHMVGCSDGTYRSEGGRVNWTGKVRMIPERLEIPLRRKKPTTYFVNSLSDLFHESLPDYDIDRVFASMALCPEHRFQILTKRSERMLSYCSWQDICNLKIPRDMVDRVAIAARENALPGFDLRDIRWPLPNVWLGVSVESKDYLYRIDGLLRTPAAVRFLSLEPLLEDLGDLSPYLLEQMNVDAQARDGFHRPPVDWAIVGGESGKGARPMPPEWVWNIRDQCQIAGVPFFFKQWGSWHPTIRAATKRQTCN